jgi:hypothetical protein
MIRQMLFLFIAFDVVKAAQCVQPFPEFSEGDELLRNPWDPDVPFDRFSSDL